MYLYIPLCPVNQVPKIVPRRNIAVLLRDHPCAGFLSFLREGERELVGIVYAHLNKNLTLFV